MPQRVRAVFIQSRHKLAEPMEVELRSNDDYELAAAGQDITSYLLGRAQ